MRWALFGVRPQGETNASLIRRGALLDDDFECYVDVVVNDYRIQTFHPDCFSQAGIDPLRPRALVAKSTQHFHAGFAPIAREILYLSAPGSGSMDMAALAHRRVTRALWPRVAQPPRGPVALR